MPGGVSSHFTFESFLQLTTSPAAIEVSKARPPTGSTSASPPAQLTVRCSWGRYAVLCDRSPQSISRENVIHARSTARVIVEDYRVTAAMQTSYPRQYWSAAPLLGAI